MGEIETGIREAVEATRISGLYPEDAVEIGLPTAGPTRPCRLSGRAPQ